MTIMTYNHSPIHIPSRTPSELCQPLLSVTKCLDGSARRASLRKGLRRHGRKVVRMLIIRGGSLARSIVRTKIFNVAESMKRLFCDAAGLAVLVST